MITTDPSLGLFADERFPKECRLRNAGEFTAVYSGGQRKASRSFVVFVLLTARPVTRFGLTTPRKLGKAPERNRIRRRVREILRRARHGFPPGMDVVVNPRRSVLGRDLGGLRSELLSLLQAER